MGMGRKINLQGYLLLLFSFVSYKNLLKLITIVSLNYKLLSCQ